MHAWPDNEMPVSKVPSPSQSNTADSLDVSGQALETLCVVFRNLPVDTTIDDIAEKLRAPPREGGCGVSISSSAYPSIITLCIICGWI